jgi:hypothetical protein
MDEMWDIIGKKVDFIMQALDEHLLPGEVLTSLVIDEPMAKNLCPSGRCHGLARSFVSLRMTTAPRTCSIR